MARRKKHTNKKQGHLWLSSVEMTGLILSEPVLYDEFPDGPLPIDKYLFKTFRNQYERFMLTSEKYRQDNQRFWINFILEDFLGIPSNLWTKSNTLPDNACVMLDAFAQTLRPTRIIVQNGEITFIVLVVDVKQNLDKVDRAEGRWKASPTTKLDKLLRETNTRIGLVTNGLSWRLLYSEPGLNTTHITWTTQGWNDERATLNAFRMLLEMTRLFKSTGKPLLKLIKDSQEKQIEIADQLGTQVREAIEDFVSEIDKLDKKHHGELLKGFSNEDIYEMCIVLMMRLVFLLYAEENGLLPHGEVIYDEGYGVNHLAYTLQQTAMENPELLAQQFDAWQSLLATFRLIYYGCEYPELKLRSYGGGLFDPARFMPKGCDSSILEDSRFCISNDTIYEILHNLTSAEAKMGREYVNQRVSYNTLDVEQIGYMYEGLLDHTVYTADDIVVKLKAKDDVKVPLSELEEHSKFDFEKWLRDITGRSKSTIKKALDGDNDLNLESGLLEFVGNEYYDRISPFASLIEEDFFARPGERYVGLGQTRRATGSHYTPQSLTEPIVRNTLAPLVYENPDRKMGLRLPEEILALKVADITVGSGAFLVQAVRYLSERLVESWENVEAHNPGRNITTSGEKSHTQDDEELLPISREERLLVARRLIVDHCIYGVDINPLAVEMAKLSLWLVTFSKDKPFTFLDHALKVGDSLLGVNLEQLKYWSLTETLEVPFSFERVDRTLKEVVQIRKQIQNIRIEEVSDAEYKAMLWKNAEEKLEWLKAAGDLIIAPVLESTNKHRQKELLASNKSAFIGFVDQDVDISMLKILASDQVGKYTPFHFVIEFPEVFLRENSGLDAVIGNPPFKGGQHLTGEFGTAYREYLVETLSMGLRGSADLCAYFFLKAFNLLNKKGKLGLLATNTIAQGATREAGLELIDKNGGYIYNSVPTMAWPGVAAVHVAKVHISKNKYFFQKMLDEQEVDYISTFLDSSKITGKPHRLKANENKSFQGSIVLGLGFVLEPEEAQALIRKNPKNKDVLFPYLNGEDLNSRHDQSPSRWVINFFDWPLNRTAEGNWQNADKKQRQKWLRNGIVPADYHDPVAVDYPDCLSIIEEKAKPERLRIKYSKTAKERWWQFERLREELYSIISIMDEVLVSCRITRNIVHELSKTNKVFDVATNIIVELKLYSTLDSTIYYWWVRKYASTLKSDIRYTLNDCFETFPFPITIENLKEIGKEYYEHRQSIMHSRQEGLTQTYNRFHDPEESSEGIQKLRDLQVEMDYAVSKAYGWDDFQLNHDFYVVSSTLNKDGERVEEIRFTVSPEAREEILNRLLKLNHERYEEEVKQGLHDKGRKKTKPKEKKQLEIREQTNLFE